MKILVTGAAGFIGYHTAQALLDRGHTVVGVDNLNPYYDPTLKEARLAQLRDNQAFRFVHLDIVNREGMAELFRKENFQRVIHLAAQAGVRHSLTDPYSYVDSNVTGTLNILEGCRYNEVEHLVYASTSSIYGNHHDMPFSEHRPTDHPLAIYSATKKATEHMAHSYAHLYRLPCTGLRFFTVYGPWGRPDMALFLFTRKILAGEPIHLFNYGGHLRDFTYIDDIVDGIIRARPATRIGSRRGVSNVDRQFRETDWSTLGRPTRVLGTSGPSALSITAGSMAALGQWIQLPPVRHGGSTAGNQTAKRRYLDQFWALFLSHPAHLLPAAYVRPGSRQVRGPSPLFHLAGQRGSVWRCHLVSPPRTAILRTGSELNTPFGGPGVER